MTIKPAEIAQLINDVYDGVERSKVGPIVLIDGNRQSVIQNVAFQTYLAILNSVAPKNVINSVKDKLL